MNNIHKALRESYLDYINDYQTVTTYAEANQLTETQAFNVLTLGKEIHEAYVDMPAAIETLDAGVK